MIGYRSALPLILLISCAVTGCTALSTATLKQVSQLPEELQLRQVAKAETGTPLTVSQKGVIAADSKDGIELISSDAKVKIIPPGPATKLLFSPSGEKLAAAYPTQNGTVLRLFDSGGKKLGETTLAEKVASLAWRSENELLAAALHVKKFSFGAELTTLLYTWNGSETPIETKLSSVTVRPHLAKLPEKELLNTLHIVVSPFSDELTYTTLKDPPVFTPYLRVITRHIESGAEHEVGKTSMGSGTPLYTPDGDSLLVGDDQGLTRRLSIPDGEETFAWPAGGSYPSISRSGSYLFLDGRVYRDGRSYAMFPTKSRAVFLPDGSGLAVSYEGRIYLVSGLQDSAPPPPPTDMQRLLQLRRLRSLGLITEKEYREQKERSATR